MSSTGKAKTAKLIRTLLNFFNSIEVQVKTLTDNMQWAKTEKRIFLKHNLEIRLAGLMQRHSHNLLTELKRLDDKMILTEVHLLQSPVYRGVGNLSKAKAALTSSWTAANAIYCPLILQGSLDLQFGVLLAEDKEYKTPYTYFFEAFENLSAQGDENALGALKYMFLCRVMLNLPEDVTSLLTIKVAFKYMNLRDVESMRAIARAHQNGNLADFEKALKEYQHELASDPTIRSHLTALHDTLVEQNLLCIVKLYSVVEISYVAEMVGQERQAVEAKLSQMISDKVLYGVLDQGHGCLFVYDEPESDIWSCNFNAGAGGESRRVALRQNCSDCSLYFLSSPLADSESNSVRSSSPFPCDFSTVVVGSVGALKRVFLGDLKHMPQGNELGTYHHQFGSSWRIG